MNSIDNEEEFLSILTRKQFKNLETIESILFNKNIRV